MFARNFGVTEEVVLHQAQISWFMQVWAAVTAAFPAAGGKGSG